jgi:hypothetical protein
MRAKIAFILGGHSQDRAIAEYSLEFICVAMPKVAPAVCSAGEKVARVAASAYALGES